jgi:hypothetical protein
VTEGETVIVKLYRIDAAAMPEVGTLEFFGTPVGKADGSSWLNFEANDQPCAGQVRLTPANVATGTEIRAVADALCRNQVAGQAGRYEWLLSSAPHNQGH